MESVTGTYTVSVGSSGPPPNPLTITPVQGTLPNETEGVAVPAPGDPLAHVSGGTPPYSFQVSGLPDGMGLNATNNADGSTDVTIDGTPSAGDAAKSPFTIQLTVTDSAVSPAKAGLARRLP